uniref:MAPK kinase substrate protein n=1 Tax=Fagus sylvatica TaxID=28930 RepID=A0A2N9I4B8_FAGSY
MSGLQRSTTSFRRQGSSGLVWNDKFLSGDINKMKATQQAKEEVEFRELRPSRSVGSIGLLERSRSKTEHAYLTDKNSPPTMDPPSPKFAGCGFCAIFGKPVMTHQPKSNKRRSK